MGVICFNIIETWLNAKTCDGALETRKLIKGKINEILQTDEIAKYSMQEGGAMQTLIVCFNNKNNKNDFMLNNTKFSYNNIYMPGFLKEPKQCNFKNVSIKNYIGKLKGGRSKNKFGTNTKFWKSFIYYNFDDSDKYYLIVKRRINIVKNKSQIRNDGNFKLIKTNDFKKILDERFEGEIKNVEVTKEIGLWLLGYANTKLSIEALPEYTNAKLSIGSVSSKISINYELSDAQLYLFRVPDFNYYKTNRPEKFNTYMTWIENNMNDKNTFLAGIDTEFETLIRED